MGLRASGVIGVLLLLVLPGADASAQSFLQSLFGLGPPPARTQPPPPPAGYRPPYGTGSEFFRDLFENDAPRPPVTAYRTLCVRMCDGYYFPISFATSRGGLDADAEKCSASCGGQARLFFYANPGGDVGSARDFTGLHYEALPNAFKYRKTLVEGCQCKPQPWSEEEKQRHQAYAAAALARRPDRKPPPTAQRLPSEGEERPLALLRRASAPADDATEPGDQDAPTHSAPVVEPTPPARRRVKRVQGEDGFFGTAKSVLFGGPPALPRR